MRLAAEPRCRECGVRHERCPEDCGIVTDDCEGGPCAACMPYVLELEDRADFESRLP